MIAQYTEDAVQLLHQLIGTTSFSREEEGTAAILFAILKSRGVEVQQSGYNVWARNKHWTDGKPVILLNSHHDTVKPAKGYTRDPFVPQVEGDQLFGLGSNDAGGPLVSLLFTFLHFYERPDLPYNLILAATAEEEISGPNGIASLLPELGNINLGIVGEPTQMQLAIAEKGLMVIDGEAIGRSGHAARNEGLNALYIALEDIQWIRDFSFPEVSPFLGPVKASVTQIQAGSQHNVVPDRCNFVIDVRTNELYSNEEAFNILQSNTKSILKARSYRLNSSRLPEDHPIVQKGKSLGLTTFGSPTLSDQALMSFPTLKIGPGDSARSHTADEYIKLSELREGIGLYIELLEGLNISG